ncbi:transposase [Streptomyces sp. NPDC003036]|uniref:transposase n=1 Tax=Streptomyces sp. NPDC003036 TaxID=3154442 RepID=UPI0033B4FDE6
MPAWASGRAAGVGEAAAHAGAGCAGFTGARVVRGAAASPPGELGGQGDAVVDFRDQPGRIDVARLRRAVANVPLPRASDGRSVLAVNVSPWLRPGADTPARTARSVTPSAGAWVSTRWCLAGPTRSWPRWRRAGLPGPRSWTRSAWSPARTWPRQPPSRSARSFTECCHRHALGHPDRSAVTALPAPPDGRERSK